MEYPSEKVLPYNGEERKSKQVSRMFDTIAEDYDSLNRTMSFGFDKGWRRKGVAFLKPFHPKRILDIATGTGDLAIRMCRTLHPEEVIGADISEGMMEIGRKKAAEAGLNRCIRFEKQDCTQLTYPDASFDAVTAAFGIRNFEETETGIREMYRVLKPGGHVMILELSTPVCFPVKQIYRFYAGKVIPWLGKRFSRQQEAYRYLPESIKVVPQGRVMTDLLTRCGFADARSRTFTFGTCSLYTGTKK